MSKKFHFSKEMGITRDDLYRALPSIFEQQPYEIKENLLISENDQGRLTIKIVKEDFRKLASMKVPRLLLDFSFEDYTKDQIKNFTERFLLHLHKGGG